MIPLKMQPFAEWNSSRVFWIALGFFILPVSLIKIYDPDIWWHMQLGKDMLDTGQLPDFSKYYFTPVVKKVADLRFTWLGDISLYLIHHFFGDVGLQLLRLTAVFLACFILGSICGKRLQGWHLLFLMMLVLGTFQQQLIRNSLFSLVFTPLVFWLWWQVRHRDRNHAIWFFPVLMGIWGCIHGSYLMGFGLMLLLFLGDSIDSLRKVNANKKPLALKYVTVTAVSFLLISLWNPLTSQFFGIEGLKRLFSDVSGHGLAVTANDSSVKLPERGPEVRNPEDSDRRHRYVLAQLDGSDIKKGFHRLKRFLNDTLFEYSEDILRSGEFVSPFDMLDRMYVKIGMFTGFAGVILVLFFIRPIRLSMILPLTAAIFFGLGYLRMIGYIPIVVTFICFAGFSSGELKLSFPEKPMLGLCGLLIVLMYVNLATGYRVPIGTEMHAFGFGRIPTFSEKIPDKIFSDYRETPVFTTIVNGGYFLYRWYPRKKVFLDGFFAPHPPSLRLEYSQLLSGKMDPAEIHHRYGVELAVIEQTRTSLLLIFFQSPNWNLKYIDKGQMAFVYHPGSARPMDIPEILEDEATLLNLPRIYRDRFAFFLYLVQKELLKKGRLKDVHEFQDKYRTLIARMLPHMPSQEYERLQALANTLTAIYGKTNSSTIQYEMLHFSHLTDENASAAISYGLKVLQAVPYRFPVILNVASLFARQQQWIQSQQYLERIWKSREMDTTFWKANQFNIAKLYLNLFFMKKKTGEHLEAFKSLMKAREADSNIIEPGKLYDEGIRFVRELTDSGKAGQAFMILKEMETGFPDSGRLCNEIAWHILMHPQAVFESAESAEKYALKAVKLMEQEQDPLVDTSYDTLAEAYHRLRRFDLMRHYELLALKTAPEERKKLYKQRNPQ
jgi:tetratricopeptide (TPR) repeat protein